MILAPKHHSTHFDCINRTHICKLSKFMAFQDNTFSMPSHLSIYFHILFLSMITLQMRSLMMKGLNQDWNWVLHPPGAVWYDWLSGWLADRRPVVKSELTCFGERQERTCHVSSAGLETQKSKGKGEKWEIKNARGIAILASCTMCKHSCMIAF